MTDILTVTLNPALDVATSVEEVVPGDKLRCSPPITDPGGGGINVARAIIQLGGKARAFVALGGGTGLALQHQLECHNIPTVIYGAPGETRRSLAVTDLSLNDQFRFMLPGPDWTPEDVKSSYRSINANAPQGGYIVLSGSGPSGTGPDIYSNLCAELVESGAKTIVDTSGAALEEFAAGLETPPYILRMDEAEAESLTGSTLPERIDTANFASDLVAKGAAEIVIVARGSDGNVLATKDKRWFCAAVNVEVKSKVGAGDSFVGGVTLALSEGKDLPTALTYGAAAASAACMTEGTDLCQRDDFDHCLAQTEIIEL